MDQFNGSRNSNLEERPYCTTVKQTQENTIEPANNYLPTDVEISQQNACPIIFVSEAEPENVMTSML